MSDAAPLFLSRAWHPNVAWAKRQNGKTQKTPLERPTCMAASEAALSARVASSCCSRAAAQHMGMEGQWDVVRGQRRGREQGGVQLLCTPASLPARQIYHYLPLPSPSTCYGQFHKHARLPIHLRPCGLLHELPSPHPAAALSPPPPAEASAAAGSRWPAGGGRGQAPGRVQGQAPLQRVGRRGTL